MLEAANRERWASLLGGEGSADSALAGYQAARKSDGGVGPNPAPNRRHQRRSRAVETAVPGGIEQPKVKMTSENAYSTDLQSQAAGTTLVAGLRANGGLTHAERELIARRIASPSG
ncbi:FAD linked oxidase family protein [Bradyrhizobium oligotrophicum S58]|uniref:FAD linked oxidase family protein n=1 Tax=Bradyrhizobium oligotrophicum S58 TaxID=1245469 RepID=M4Z7B2_9BRAD|nr:FAD linked oxidase family protein [Bradyrhizobium oligotrophicum S58]